MAKYMFVASYTPEGAKGLLKEGGTGRQSAVAAMATTGGGNLEAFYFAFGEDDAYVIVDVPDDATAAAISLTVSAAGGATVKTVKLLTPEEIDQAAKKAVQYRPPGV